MTVSVVGYSHPANIIYPFSCCIVFLMMAGEHFMLGAFWLFYGIVHSLLASVRIKQYFKQRFAAGNKYYRLGYNLLAVSGLAGIILFQLSIDSMPLFRPNPFSDIIGASITISGALLMFICLKKYFAGLSGLRSFFHEDVSAELFISGVHRFVRHPLYLGTFGFIWGLLMLFPTLSLLVSNVIITSYTLIGIRLEEKKLQDMFGEKYRSYQKNVRMLIPKIKGDREPITSPPPKAEY